MSGSNNSYSSYSSYYHHPPSSSVSDSSESWKNWSSQRQQYTSNYARNNTSYNSSSHNLNQSTHNNLPNNLHSSHLTNYNNYRPQSYLNTPPPPLPPPPPPPQRPPPPPPPPPTPPASQQTNRYYYRNRYSNNNSNLSSSNQYSGNENQQYHGWQRNLNNYKRSRQDSIADNEPQLKTTKKKKKPLSQNIPSKREWNRHEAEEALALEKQHNKKSKNALIIKFPDQELNKDIVSQFHPAIANVHFQQPCTPRFCFVTLQDSANTDEVINELNQKQFGNGYLSVEYKKDREDNQRTLADDIDPYTLYIGNLAQEVTKEDMVSLYPLSKRIDIGYAKKMKFTRYAFIGFRTAKDSIAAFKRTHNKQMYNKSLIVRFRRLHGTVGMPGELKPQNPSRSGCDGVMNSDVMEHEVVSKNTTSTNHTGVKVANQPVIAPPEVPLPAQVSTASKDEALDSDIVNFDGIKQEHLSSPEDSEDEYSSNMMLPEFLSERENREQDDTRPVVEDSSLLNIKPEVMQPLGDVKSEPTDYNNDNVDWNERYYDKSDEDNEDDDMPRNVTDFNYLYESMVQHSNRINALKGNGT